nr:MAG: hypothetical protein [Bacteriophage sp.]
MKQNNTKYQFDKESGIQRTSESEKGIQQAFIESRKIQPKAIKEEFLYQQD